MLESYASKTRDEEAFVKFMWKAVNRHGQLEILSKTRFVPTVPL